MNRVNIMGCGFDAWSTEQTLKEIGQLIERDERAYLCTVNVAILMMMRKDPRLANFILSSKMIVADGQPLIWTSRYMKTELPERVTGVELVQDLADMAEKNNWGVYLLGGTNEVVNSVVSNLTLTRPSLKISGFSDGYFDKEGAKERAAAIRESNAKILIVAMGVPRQESFIEDNWQDFGANFVIGVGGSFDVIAGVTARAPVWMQNSGLEWLYRTIQEPRRLIWRYLTTNTLFIYLFIKEIVFGIGKNKECR